MYSLFDKTGRWRSITLLAIGAASSLLAIGLVVRAGLPERAAFTGWSVEGQTVAPEVNARSPLFERPSIDGRAVDLAELRGNLVIINFWATWCAPCALEMPILQEIYDEHADNQLHILAVNMGESPQQVTAWLDSRGFTYDILLDPGLEVTALYRVRVQPSTFVIAPDGAIIDIFYGPVTAGQLISALGPYLS